MLWYITVAAVHNFQNICNLPLHNDGPIFDETAKQLSSICEIATLKKDEGHRQIYLVKTKIKGKIARLELTVSKELRKEGPLPQLVRVRYKGSSRTGKQQ